MDSGSEENVCPKGWGSQFATKPVDRKLNLRGASGGWIEHFGRSDVQVVSPF